MRLYHGTRPENVERIEADGLHPSPWSSGNLFFTPDRDRAVAYAMGGAVVEVEIPESMVKAQRADGEVVVAGPVAKEHIVAIQRVGTRKTASAFQPSFVAAWGASKPWDAPRDLLEAQMVPGFRVGPARGTEAASFERGFIVLKPEWFTYPTEARRAICYHEAGHGLEEAAGHDACARVFGVDNALDIATLPGASRFGHNYSEVIATAYQVAWDDPGWATFEGGREILAATVRLAREHGWPIPLHTASKQAATETPRLRPTGPTAAPFARIEQAVGEPIEVLLMSRPGNKNHHLSVSTYGTENPLYPRFTDRKGRKPVASIMWSQTTGVIAGILVEAPYQRRGIATALLELAKASNLKPEPVHSDVRTSDGAAWVESLGSVLAGIDRLKGEDGKRRLSLREVERKCREVVDAVGHEHGVDLSKVEIVLDVDYLPPLVDARYEAEGRDARTTQSRILVSTYLTDDLRDPDTGIQGFRQIAHEATHAASDQLFIYEGHTQQFEEAATEILSVWHWAHEGQPFGKADAFREDGKWIDGARALVHRANYHEWVGQVLRRAASKVGWNPSTMIGYIASTHRNHRAVLDFMMDNDPEFAPPPGVSGDGESLLLWLITEGMAKQAARTVYYHGTFRKLPPGTILRPSGEGGIAQPVWGYATDADGSRGIPQVWMTDDPQRARQWASDGAWSYGRSNGMSRDESHELSKQTFVYAVEPIGKIEVGEESLRATDYKADAARVLYEVDERGHEKVAKRRLDKPLPEGFTIVGPTEFATDQMAVTCLDPQGRTAGQLIWNLVRDYRKPGGVDNGWIDWVAVTPQYRRMGIAANLLYFARDAVPYPIRHSTMLTGEGEPWSEKVAWKPGDTVGWINEVITKDYPPRGGGACMIVSQVVEKEMGYKGEEGIYWSGRSLEDAIEHETVYGHWWNWKPNGDIFDGTGGQFHPSGDTVREVRKGSPEFKHYVTWRTLYDTQSPEVCERIEEIIQHAYPKFSARLEATAMARVASGGKLYHLTDKRDFRLNPKKRPTRNTTMGGEMKPGIFLAPDPERWVNGYGYWRPWVVEFEAPPGVGIAGGYGGEVFVLAEDYDKLRLTRVLPLDGYCREAYHEWGWTEEWFEDDAFTGEPLPKDHNDMVTGRPPAGWRSPDARTMSDEWAKQYAARIKRYRRENPEARGAYVAALASSAVTYTVDVTDEWVHGIGQATVEAHKDGEVVGRLLAHPDFYPSGSYRCWKVWNIGVEEAHRRQGIARGMIEALHRQYPKDKIMHSGFASGEGQALAESLPPSWNRVKGWDDHDWRKPLGKSASIQVDASQALYFHMGTSNLPIGTVLVPGGPGGRNRWHDESQVAEEQRWRLDHVWLAPSADLAYGFGLKMLNHGVNAYVYLVRPMGRMEMSHTDWQDAWITDRAEVVAQFPLRYDDLRDLNRKILVLPGHRGAEANPAKVVLDLWREDVQRGTDFEMPKFGSASGVRIMDPELIGWSGGQSDLVVYAFANDQVVGSLHYSTFDGEVYVNGIEVRPDHQRQGIATDLWSKMVEAHPGVKVNPGYFTADGAAWYRTLHTSKVAGYGGSWDGKHYIRFGLIPRRGPDIGAKTAGKTITLTPLPMGPGIFYRLQGERPFDPNNATSTPSGGFTYEMAERNFGKDHADKWFTTRPGYSAFPNPEHVRQYVEEMDWDKGKVVAFRGTIVGVGLDDEPLVQPQGGPIETIEWEDFEDRIEVTPGAHAFPRWDSAEDGGGWDFEVPGQGPRWTTLKSIGARMGPIQREGAIALPPLHDTLYPVVFDGLKARPEVKARLYEVVNSVMPEGTKGQVRLWLEGSGASFNWDEGGDLDVQVWVALATPVGTTAAVREALSPMHGAPLTSIGIDGAMEIQFYVHAGDGTPEDALKAKPYALYDLDTDTWAVMPVPQTPAMYAERFQRAQGPASAYADQAEQAMGALDRANQSIEFAKATGIDPAPYEDQAAIANQQIRDLYAHIKDGRAQAYGPGGDGLYDVRDTIVKVLEAWGIWQRLVALVDPLPAADPVPAA